MWPHGDWSLYVPYCWPTQPVFSQYVLKNHTAALQLDTQWHAHLNLMQDTQLFKQKTQPLGGALTRSS